MSRPRILQVITRLGLGGSEKVALSIVQGLRTECDFAVFTVYRKIDDEVGIGMRRELAAAGVPWLPGTGLDVKHGGLLTGALALRRAVQTFRPDVIHYHTEIPEASGATLSALSPGFARLPALRTIHNSIFWRFWPRIGRWCDHRLAPARVVCVSEAARAEFLRYRADSGAPPAQPPPAVLYNGVAISPRPVRSGLLNPGVCRVLFAGRFEPQKGLDVLCAALPLVRLPSGLRVEFTAVGHGVHETLLHTLAQHPPDGWRTSVRPPVAALPDLFNEFDLVVMPSRFEGLALIAIETILCGVPLAATSAPGLKEILPADHPWLAPPEDPAALAAALSRAIGDPSAWARTMTAAQQYAIPRFSPERMLTAYRELYTAG